jgi:predicted secreted hydrolase
MAANTKPPKPVPPSEAQIFLPADHYLHLGAPTEWWWHTGTLKAKDRLFGFEINAASYPMWNVAFTQIMLTDVVKARHYQRTTVYVPPKQVNLSTWAEHDPHKNWHVGLSGPEGSVTMDAASAHPTKNMAIRAKTTDQTTGTPIAFDLTMSQEGPPLLVWGTGAHKMGGDGPPLTTTNFYYSLTRIAATGTVTLGDESFPVSGRTWMDHEYGRFTEGGGGLVKWIFQAIQLENGWSLSNFLTVDEGVPKLGHRSKSLVTLLAPKGDLYFVDSFMTPTGRTWTSPDSKNTYFLEFKVEVPSFDAVLTVTSSVDGQEFPSKTGPSVYEGVASAVGSFKGQQAHGTAWNEQAL